MTQAKRITLYEASGINLGTQIVRSDLIAVVRRAFRNNPTVDHITFGSAVAGALSDGSLDRNTFDREWLDLARVLR